MESSLSRRFESRQTSYRSLWTLHIITPNLLTQHGKGERREDVRKDQTYRIGKSDIRLIRLDPAQRDVATSVKFVRNPSDLFYLMMSFRLIFV